MAENWLQLPPLSTWPQPVVLKSSDLHSELYYLNRVWKTVQLSYLQSVLKDVDQSSEFYSCRAVLENYKEKSALVGYDPLSAENNVFLCPTLESVHQLQDRLKALQQEYQLRVQHAKIRAPKCWFSSGSEEEVDQERAESSREKISVEWIGCLEKRQTKVGQFIDVDAKDSNCGFEEIVAEDKKQYRLELKTHLHIGVQVDVKQEEGWTQSDIDQYAEIAPIFQEDIDDETNLQSLIKTENVQKFEQIHTADLPIDKEYLNYFKSFVNTEKRQKIIASLTWHPTRVGFAAIAYVDGIDTRENRSQGGVKNKNLVPDKESAVNDADVTVNEAIFDILSRRGDAVSEDSDENFFSASENGIESDEESLAGLPKNFGISDILIYQDSKDHVDITASQTEENNPQAKKEFSLTEGLMSEILASQGSPPHCEEDDKWSTTSSEKSISSEESKESETGTQTTLHSFLNIPLYEDDFSDNSSSVVDEVPFLDTDSSVLIWNCENDLFPQIKLYNVYETQIVRFCPINGDFIAGGSSSGQLILWHLEGRFQNPPQKSRLENCDIIRDFMENLPLWPTEDEKYPTIHPIVVSERSISHLYPITYLEWLHPSLQVTETGALVKVKMEENLFSEQIFTSSSDGTIKIWDLKKRMQFSDNLDSSTEDSDIRWTLDLLYNLLVTNPHADRYWTPIRIFKVFTPTVKYRGPKEDGCYEYVSDLNSKFDMIVAVTNDIGEVGVVRWSQKKSDENVPKKAERCEHEWWGICHDDIITSMSQNSYFPKILLTVGGHIFALWNIEFKKGPIWWQQYSAKIIITEGCFTPFHPAIIYIARSDGYVDIWDLTKQIHKPVMEVLVSGFSISDTMLEDRNHCMQMHFRSRKPKGRSYSEENAKRVIEMLFARCYSVGECGALYHSQTCQFLFQTSYCISSSKYGVQSLSISVPPCPNYQIGIADSNGNFHILRNQYDMAWNENDILVVGQFFERAKESRRQLLRWNGTWKQQSTYTDMYGFEHKPQKKKFQMPDKRQEKLVADSTDLRKTEEKFPDTATFLEKIVQSDEYKEELKQDLAKMKLLHEERYEQKRQELLTEVKNVVLDDPSVDEIYEKYLYFS